MKKRAESNLGMKVIGLSDLDELEGFVVNGRVEGDAIIDCRAIDAKGIVTKSKEVLELLRRDNVEQVWVKKEAKGANFFLELKNRLKNEHRDSNNVSLLKLNRFDEDLQTEKCADLGRKLASFGALIPHMEDMMASHPGVIWAMMKTCKRLVEKESLLRHAEKTDQIGTKKRKLCETYADERRSKRRMFKAWKNFADHIPDNDDENDKKQPRIHVSFVCYICKKSLKESFKDVFCPACKLLNEQMKMIRVDLTGRYAVVTGARIKIGFVTALRLLRNGCFVVASSRFPADALVRFRAEDDFDEWKSRLKIARLDLENLASIEEFLAFVKSSVPHLDILINNAAQTIYRPAKFYEKLTNDESNLLEKFETHTEAKSILVNTSNNRLTTRSDSKSLKWSINANDEACHFPVGLIDDHGQQLDLRPRNSWTYNLDEVPLKELLQVLTVNSVGPFYLISNLKSMLMKSPNKRKFVVNVSAMEGQFSRVHKGHRHPHTNMAKAALNMLTRTSGIEFQMDSIYMTAVDTGWITDERPFNQAKFEAERKGFRVPLNCEDGAARILHPIFEGIQNSERIPFFAVFLKDFRVHPW